MLLRVVNPKLMLLRVVNPKNINCQNCVYYRSIITPYEHSKLCTLYIFASTPKEPEIKFIDADYCRNNESLCGKDAKYFKNK